MQAKFVTSTCIHLIQLVKLQTSLNLKKEMHRLGKRDVQFKINETHRLEKKRRTGQDKRNTQV